MNKKTKKWLISITATLLIIITILFVACRNRYDIDLPERNNESSIIIHEDMFTKLYLDGYYNIKNDWFNLNSKKNQNKIMFLGDSITDICDLSKYFPTLDAINYGISGDTTRGVLSRLDVVYKANPKLIVLLIGTNDFMNEHRSVDNVLKDYELIISNLQENLENAIILCESIYPGYDGNKELVKEVYEIDYLNESFDLCNAGIIDICNKYNINYIDINSVLKLDGSMNPSYSDDGCHPNSKGYETLSPVLLNKINMLLGE